MLINVLDYNNSWEVFRFCRYLSKNAIVEEVYQLVIMSEDMAYCFVLHFYLKSILDSIAIDNDLINLGSIHNLSVDPFFKWWGAYNRNADVVCIFLFDFIEPGSEIFIRANIVNLNMQKRKHL